MVKVVSLAIARDGASGGVVRTVTVSVLFVQIPCLVSFGSETHNIIET